MLLGHPPSHNNQAWALPPHLVEGGVAVGHMCTQLQLEIIKLMPITLLQAADLLRSSLAPPQEVEVSRGIMGLKPWNRFKQGIIIHTIVSFKEVLSHACCKCAPSAVASQKLQQTATQTGPTVEAQGETRGHNQSRWGPLHANSNITLSSWQWLVGFENLMVTLSCASSRSACVSSASNWFALSLQQLPPDVQLQHI